jgi:FMN-dependent oxidoreductase (nitrilotriacetate monooxygenase family)
MTAKQLVLNAFTMNTPGHLSPGSWRNPGDRSADYLRLEHWQDLARTLERGLFDAVFLADVLGVYDVYKGNRDTAVAGALQVPVNDPLQVVPAMATVTEHLGFGITSSVSFEHPFPFARRLSTLDHLTNGRVGWNVVTSYLNSGALNLGLDAQVAHDRRYDIADEYLEVCYKLWERSWDDDAVVRDAEAGVYAVPDRVHDIAHQGEFFRVPGIHLAEPSPQRTPVIYQAGASPRGIAFATKHAESIFVATPSRELLARQITGLREALAASGRAPVTVIEQATVVVAETDADAQRDLERYNSYGSRDGVLALMSGWMGTDLSQFDPDAPLQEQPSQAIQSTMKAFSSADPSRTWTIREIAEYGLIGGDGPVFVGSAETVANQIEAWVEQTDVDGFNLAAAELPHTYEAVADLLVPELQKRGRFKKEYRSGTLRHKLSGAGPRVTSDHAAAQVAIPGLAPAAG